MKIGIYRGNKLRHKKETQGGLLYDKLKAVVPKIVLLFNSDFQWRKNTYTFIGALIEESFSLVQLVMGKAQFW